MAPQFDEVAGAGECGGGAGNGSSSGGSEEAFRPRGAASGQLRKLDFLHSLERASAQGAAAVRAAALSEVAAGASPALLRYSRSAGVGGAAATPTMGARLPPLLGGGGGCGAAGPGAGAAAGTSLDSGSPGGGLGARRVPRLPSRHIASAPSAMHAPLQLPSRGGASPPP